MTSDETRLNALIRIMNSEQKAKLVDVAKDILMTTQQLATQKGEMRYAETQHP